MFKKICKLCWSEYKGWLSSKYCSNECRGEALKQINKRYYDKTHSKEYKKEYTKKDKWTHIVEFTNTFGLLTTILRYLGILSKTKENIYLFC